MTDQEKIETFDRMVEMFNLSVTTGLDPVPVKVGTLNKRQGIKGFVVAEIGHPVFELKDRYLMYLKSEYELVEKIDNVTHKRFFTVCIPYYKDTLRPSIDFD